MYGLVGPPTGESKASSRRSGPRSSRSASTRHSWSREINDERNGLHERKQAVKPGLLDALPMGEVGVEELPEDVARRLFEVLRLELHYRKSTNQIKCTATLLGTTVRAAH